MSNQNTLAFRYPGAQPFRSSQERIFCGRAEDIARLHRAITLNGLTVLYGDSGLGKTSLLNAGVLPQFSKVNLLTVFPRFYAYNTKTKHPSSPLDGIRKHLGVYAETAVEGKDQTKKSAPTIFMPSVQGSVEKQTLWQLVKSIQWHNRTSYSGIIIIFDQFEELFSYPDAEIERFGLEMGELLNNRMPEKFKEQFYKVLDENPQSIQTEELNFIENALPTKIVLGIRQDRLGLLKRISPYYPDILLDQNLFELQPLTQKQAEEAIRIPALLGGPEDPYLSDKGYTAPRFDTKWFKYHQATLDNILDYLTNGGEKTVDTTQLQIICQHIETKIVRTEGQVVEADDVKDLSQISQNYYDNVIGDLPIGEQATVRDMIEKSLIFEPDQLRLNLYDKQIHSLYPGISDETLAALVDSHLLRVEQRSGDVIYELSHDALVAPILAAKKIRDEEAERKRLIEEEKALLEKRQAEEKAQRAAREEAERQERLRRQNRANFIFALVAGSLFLIALFAAIQAYRQSVDAKAARKEAEQQKIIAEQNAIEAQKNAAVAQVERDSAVALRARLGSETYKRRYEQGKLLMEGKKFSDALPNLEEALGINAPERNEAELRELIAKCKVEIPKEKRFNELMKQADELRDQHQNYLGAYPLYNAALELKFDNTSAQQKLEFCRIQLLNKLSEELRRAETFKTEGKDCGDALQTIRDFVDPILETLKLPSKDKLRVKRDTIWKACR